MIWKKIILEKLIIGHLVKKFPFRQVLEPIVSQSCLQGYYFVFLHSLF
jgi:hypothetical protein